MHIHLFMMRLPKTADSAVGAVLERASDEKKRILYRTSKAKEHAFSSMASQVMMRYAVSKVLDVAMRAVHIGYTDAGKPFIKDRDVFVSLSHTDAFCVCAVSDAPVGVDAEKIRPFPKRICEKYFSEAEKERLRNSADFDKTAFEIWTEHESFVKLTGEGLRAIGVPIPENVHTENMVFEEEYCISWSEFTTPT